jgi:5-methylcytosine-specific restriction endonuclease McrA
MPHRVPTFRPPWLPTRRVESRPNSTQRGYGSAAWQRVRLAVIARDGGLCRSCGKLIHQAGDAHIDHIGRKRIDETAEATPIEGLQLLCRSCHSEKTYREPH